MVVTRKNDEKLRDVSRRMIMDRTARLLLDRGYSATSLRDIAQTCEMKAGSLYYHFESKDKLIEEILKAGVRQVQTAVGEALDNISDATPLERIRTAMSVHLGTLHEKSDYASAHIRCFAHVPADIRHRLGDVRREYEAIWTTLLEDAKKSGEIASDIDLRVLRYALFGMMNWTLEWRRPTDRKPGDIADDYFRLAFSGIGKN